MTSGRIISRLLLFAFCFPVTVGCAPIADIYRYTFRGTTMGTTFSVTVVGEFMSNQVKAELEVSIKDRLDKLDAMMSTYKPDSEVSRFNDWESSDWFGVSPDTAQVFQHAREVSEVTGGAFDVTVAPLVDVWGFGPVGPLHTLPSDSDINRLLGAVDFRQIEVNDVSTALRKTSIHVKTDVSAVAKGYAVDRIADLLDARNYDSYLIEIGGEVRTRGRREEGQSWRIGIEQPTENLGLLQRVVQLSDAALATSGDYRNYFELDGVRYSHTIDPRTGRPITHELAAVSVIDVLCVRADALATALEVLGPNEAYDLAEELGLAVLLIIREEDGSYRELFTPSFLSRTVDPTG